MPATSVLLATYRRPRSLVRTLSGLLAQEDTRDVELVVVDNDPAGGARAAVGEAASVAPFPVRYVVEPVPGASHARNRAISEAGGDVVAILDDDVVPAPSWLTRVTAPVLAGEADVVGGRVVLDPAVSRPPWFDEVGIGGYLTRVDVADHPLHGPQLVPYLVTANFACRMSRLRSSGGFDPAMGPRGRVPLVGDDVMLVRRLAQLGARLMWEPAAVVVHELPPDRLRRSYLLRRAWAQGRSDWLLDRDELRRRRLRGARVPLSWLSTELGRRRREGLAGPAVRFHAACDVARTLGALREAAVPSARS